MAGTDSRHAVRQALPGPPQPDEGSLSKLPFVVMAKPVGSVCNLRCDYCYYLGTDYGGGHPPKRMSDETLETFIRSFIEAACGPNVAFTWHGGEPALAGLSFYKKVALLQSKYLLEGMTVTNNLQTNGTLLDDAFCDFLAEHHFDVSLSIDGTRAIHDAHRRFASDGSPSWQQSADAIRRLLERGIRPDLLCTVHADSVPHAREIYRTLRDLNTGWIQFIPIVNRIQDPAPETPTAGPETLTAVPGAKHPVTEDSVTPEGYGAFLKEVFFEWFFHDLGKTNIQLFAETAAVLAGGTASVCTMAETCGNVLVTEHDGSIYACDHFVDAAHRLGQVGRDDFQTLLHSEAQQAFGLRKRDALTGQCLACPYLRICRGECPKNRFVLSKDSEPGHNYLCPGLITFFDYAVPLLRQAMDLSMQHIPSAQIMQRLTQKTRQAYAKVGRNDPCPCGSGKKFKACCARWVP